MHCGRGGVYYRSFLESGPGTTPKGPGQRYPPASDSTDGVQRAIDSGDVSAMSPQTAASLLAELQRRNSFFPWYVLYAVAVGAATIAAFALDAPVLGAMLAFITLAGTILLAIWAGRRREFRITYRLDDDYSRRYSAVLSAFERLRCAQRIWLIESEANVYDRKYHAGASKTIRRTRVRPTRSLPPCFKSNITPPMVPAGRQRLYLLPDRILVYEGRRVGAIEYNELRLEAVSTRFIEDEAPPTDAHQVDSTWKYVNKKGGPDRRFNDNRQLPIMHYGELRWSSSSGLNELHQVSAPEAAAAFAQVVADLALGLVSVPSPKAASPYYS